ncbi:hypothetical protein B0T24DRAFT_712501 [Lasiosphaeria ovina]|uniref:NACHT domain-containing protein n=1 Tax=Lasiosphaeria ovina TaxID=92902 RepID=A0AAE0MZX3_9PEZI|nr:hypothetical protein B0T24DRAFT_712501 [Lasiosphaeria ovina]
MPRRRLRGCTTITLPERAVKKLDGYCHEDTKKLLGYLRKLKDVSRAIEAGLTAEVSQMLGELQSMTQTIPIQYRILQQLIYGDYNYMRTRRSQIRDASRETCGWILGYDGDKPGDHKSDWQFRVETSKAFRRWLREGQNIQHISDNPGAGKSTLRRAPDAGKSEDSRISRVLLLHRRDCYGENPAGSLQNPPLRDLEPPLVFPTQWQKFKAEPGERIVETREFTEVDIKTALGLLISAEGYGKYKFCLFIDGLDEYEGDRTENEEIAREKLAETLMRWAAGELVKICASSRPNREFHELFRYPENPPVHLHLVNQADISAYCVDRFQKDREGSKKQGREAVHGFDPGYCRELPRGSSSGRSL